MPELISRRRVLTGLAVLPLAVAFTPKRKRLYPSPTLYPSDNLYPRG